MKKLILILCIVFVLFISIGVFGESSKILPERITVTAAGKFKYAPAGDDCRVQSENGVFWCRYDIGKVGHDRRQLKNFEFLEGENLLFSMKIAPGSDLYISNSGFIAFLQTGHQRDNDLTIAFYTKHGQHLISQDFESASLFGFSPAGYKFGVGSKVGLQIITLPYLSVDTYENGFKFSISEDEDHLAVASKNIIKVYYDDKLINEFTTEFMYTRAIVISTVYDFVAAIDKKNLKVYSLTDGDLVFSDMLRGKYSYRDLRIENDKLVAGIHYRYDGISKGIIKAYDLEGNVILEKEKAVKRFKTFDKPVELRKAALDYPEIPWPFEPFDRMHTVWNYYEQHNGRGEGDWSYLHQGLDLIVPIEEPTYAVTPGVVKCVLTLGGRAYWRTAISLESVPGTSTGWLYAHLIENSIQVDVGDTVEIHDYLGDIIEWDEDWGHIHFVEIQDTGLVWLYEDNEWGITYNPLLSLIPDTDTIAPVIENVFEPSKFGFCLNETSTYLNPDSLYGDIDIIVKVSDYIGDSPWEQPAYELYYTIIKLPDGEIILPRRLAQILNHAYDYYGVWYYEPYATLLYKRDNTLLSPRWMDLDRDYFHILTNNNGDSLADLSEKNLAFETDEHADGDYRIIAEAYDEYGNFDIDSMDVKFRNGIVSVSDNDENQPYDFTITQNYPNPFNSSTNIRYTLSKESDVRLDIYDIRGSHIKTLLQTHQKEGHHEAQWNAANDPSGIYFYKLSVNNQNIIKRMALIK
ncbi:MAG: T9SS type A sorting domain-containing protein [candidate division Zixibacteria bacterium]|nr:T9SS type A sorting domain-containing protein [candidate division Zixibacteria bacterium]